MSFILDALKKSETDRQQQASAEFSGVPTSHGRQGPPRWLWALGLLLVVNLAVLLGLWLRPDVQPDIQPVPLANETSQPSVTEPSFADQVEQARQIVPARQPAASAARQAEAVTTPTNSAPANVARGTQTSTAALPTFIEVIANGTLVLPDLHLDIHVFSEVPEDRFVFINMSKQHENSQLREGPVVQEIRPEGVVLGYQGTTFLLPRD